MARTRGDCCLFTDADVPYELEAIPYAVSLVNGRGFDLVIGDRNLEGSRYGAELTPLRRAATAAFTVFVRLFVTSGLFDTQCGSQGVPRRGRAPIVYIAPRAGLRGRRRGLLRFVEVQSCDS